METLPLHGRILEATYTCHLNDSPLKIELPREAFSEMRRHAFGVFMWSPKAYNNLRAFNQRTFKWHF